LTAAELSSAFARDVLCAAFTAVKLSNSVAANNRIIANQPIRLGSVPVYSHRINALRPGRMRPPAVFDWLKCRACLCALAPTLGATDEKVYRERPQTIATPNANQARVRSLGLRTTNQNTSNKVAPPTTKRATNLV
jgi:hypothetical protein